jgi:hypothetical protein
MSEKSLVNLDYGYNWSTETWHVYKNGEDPLAVVTSEEYAALFAAAPGQAERIAELEAQNAALLKALEHLVEINRRDEIGDPAKLATDIWRNRAWGNAKNTIAKAEASE